MSAALNTLGSFVIDILETVVIALSIFVVIYLLAFQPHEVNGQSMDGKAGFRNGQFILTDKITYRFRDPQRGEVIVFKYPQNEEYDYIKRIIGIPGDKVQVQNNKIIIFNKDFPNGKTLDESDYLDSDVITSGKAFLGEGETVTLPDDNYFVMGDNREQSSDSRTWGFVRRDEIIGRSWFRYWKPNEVGFIQHVDL